MIPHDVTDWVHEKFKEADAKSAISLLEKAVIENGEPASHRMLRCAVYASHGQFKSLKQLVSDLKTD